MCCILKNVLFAVLSRQLGCNPIHAQEVKFKKGEYLERVLRDSPSLIQYKPISATKTKQKLLIFAAALKLCTIYNLLQNFFASFYALGDNQNKKEKSVHCLTKNLEQLLLSLRYF